MRAAHEPPPAIARDGWRYHHMGVPTTVPRAGEQYLEQFKMFVSGYQTSPYGLGGALPGSGNTKPGHAFQEQPK